MFGPADPPLIPIKNEQDSILDGNEGSNMDDSSKFSPGKKAKGRFIKKKIDKNEL